ncbi:hypothetical protein FRX31_010918 [Thalictrum thalictroides]|uniref:Uncharacterized protein n=1 Tax=Thalictrum thalictroides TaxID=46969 RepID=A0A7J6WQ50_THATH|nr:hypothetical protein FRX31_010918 [Thalictrum thalictroides]
MTITIHSPKNFGLSFCQFQNPVRVVKYIMNAIVGAINRIVHFVCMHGAWTNVMFTPMKDAFARGWSMKPLRESEQLMPRYIERNDAGTLIKENLIRRALPQMIRRALPPLYEELQFMYEMFDTQGIASDDIKKNCF